MPTPLMLRVGRVPFGAVPEAGTRRVANSPESPLSALGRITVSGLKKTYKRIGGRQLARTHALSEIDFTVEPHEFVSIIGPSDVERAR